MQNSQTKRQKSAQNREEKVISSLTQVPGRSCGRRINFRGDGDILSVGFIQVPRRAGQNFFSGSEIYFQAFEIYFSATEIYFKATEIVSSLAAGDLLPLRGE